MSGAIAFTSAQPLKKLMNAAQIKDEFRNLNRIDKTEIYRWIDEEASVDPLLGRRARKSNRRAECRPKKRVSILPF
jgi:hypothetical protein